MSVSMFSGPDSSEQAMQVFRSANQVSRGALRCKECGEEIDVPLRALSNPEVFMKFKEGIAAKHSCRKVRMTMPVVRVLRPGVVSLDSYWNGAMRRMLPA